MPAVAGARSMFCVAMSVSFQGGAVAIPENALAPLAWQGQPHRRGGTEVPLPAGHRTVVRVAGPRRRSAGLPAVL
ncbi:hypothetical protein GCM10022402_28160 [Salinactinospora qingdaonensis]|uniref:Secreted protein n=1 Tax=Salinactinospora qingdaonensis TaxID=702744 RepID=A0ABP7FVF5_9ACTN